ncbi:MAG: zinc ABC transporter solute-binding protein [Alkalinema sp. RU_4_3]|nr:zinc ABC transporter solute-binding protein [Alkalinema sp. RU_4_3]
MKSLVVLSSLSLVGLLSACGLRSAMSPTKGLPQVVVTNSVLCDLTQQIAQDSVALACLISAGTDPHLYAPTPNDRKRLETANLILYGGYNLEPELEKLIKASPQKITKVAISEVAVPKPLIAEDHDHHHDHGKEPKAASKAEPDPHVWHNVQNAINMLNAINDNLAQINPSEAETYKTRTANLTQQFTSLDSWSRPKSPPSPPQPHPRHHPRRPSATTAKPTASLSNPSKASAPKKKPTAARTKAVIDLVRSKKVPAIFPETSVSPLLIQTIARETQAKIAREPLYTDGLSTIDSSGGTYQRMIVSNTRAIVDNLGGQYKRWRP